MTPPARRRAPGQLLVLIADDALESRSALARLIRAEGFDVAVVADGDEALAQVAALQPDLIILDVMMPGLDGFEVCRHVKADEQTRLTPVVLVTGLNDTSDRVRGIEAGADDFINKPFEAVELLARARSLVRLKQYTDQLEQAEAVVFTLAEAIEGRDPYTGGHCARLATHASELGDRLGLDQNEITALRRAGHVHDLGKIAVPDAILLKAGPLTDAEREVIRTHPVVGERICRGLQSFTEVLPIIRHHHEKLDGTGYPDGLEGDRIPLTARVLQVVDVYDALRTNRPYKPALSPADALEVIHSEVDRGWWDRDVVAEFERDLF